MRAFVLLLCIACCALGGPVRGPSEVKVDVGRLQSVPLEFDGDEIEYAILGGDYFGGFREYSDPKTVKFQVLGYQSGTGYIVVGTSKGGKLQPLYTVKVIVGGAPTPPTPPAPPIPDDPEIATLATTLKNAAANDAWHPSKLTACARGYRDAASTIQLATVAEVMATLKSKMGAALNGENVSPSVYAILADKMNGVLPRTGSTPMDAAAIAKAKTLFVKLATALERAAQ